MRIVLIQRGGFVGIPLRYEVNVSAMKKETISRLLQLTAMSPVKAMDEESTAGSVCIRVERDDGVMQELHESKVGESRELADIVNSLRAHAKLIRSP